VSVHYARFNPRRVYASLRRRFRLSEARRARTKRKTAPGQFERRVLAPALRQGTQRPRVQVSETQLLRSICLQSFYDFLVEHWSLVVAEKFVPNWHIRYICNRVQKVCERIFAGRPKKGDLVINIAPGTTKSMILSVMLPAWCLAGMPSFRFIGASYSFPLQMDLSMKARDIVRSEKYRELFPWVKIREDQNTKGYFKTRQGGFRYAVGVNGAVLGMHAHLIVVDDPLNPQEALSAADILSANHWIKHTLSTRKVDKKISVTILVMQRLHQDDPSANMLQQKDVSHICLPAEIAENANVQPPELKSRYKDGLLDANRLDQSVLAEERAKGSYYYSGQFLQEPVPASGGMFKVMNLKAGPRPEKFQKLVRYWDKAATLRGGNWTVGTLMGLDHAGLFWVLDVVRVQLDSYARERLIEKTAETDGYETEIGVEEEAGSGGKESAQSTVKRLAGYRVRTFKVDATTGGKEARADPFSVQVNAGNVYLPEEYLIWSPGKQKEWLDWAKPFVEELKYFPHSKYKDQVDSAAGAFSMLHKKRVRVGGFVASEHFKAPEGAEKKEVRARRYYKALSMGRYVNAADSHRVDRRHRELTAIMAP
jgi:predicted phage terminase large subunit-like protein